MSDPDAHDPYARPELYDLEYADLVEDLEYYTRIARKAQRVLELGCGTGRLTLPMARAGATVTGVDASAPMLQRLERRLRLEPVSVKLRVTLRLGSWDEQPEQGPFEAILWPFNALHHSADAAGLASTLRRLRALLHPEGRLWVDAYLPDHELYRRPPGRYEPRTFRDPRDGQPLESWEESWFDQETRIHHVFYVYQRPDRTEHRIHLKLRMFERPELLQAVQEGGFALEHEHSDFKGRPLEPGALKWVACLRPS